MRSTIECGTVAVLGLVLLTAAAEPSHADCLPAEAAKLLAPDGATGDVFGESVSIAGNTVVIGSVYDDHPGATDAGSAYVFVLSGGVWTQQAKLTAADPAASDYLGAAVSVSGDTAVIGATGDDHAGGTDAGSAYVFVRSGTVWAQQAKLTASDAATSDGFGSAVSVSGDTAVIGVLADSHAGGVYAGSAYVFVRSGGVWTEQAKLIASDAAASDYFGVSVSIFGDTAAIGAFGDDLTGGTNAGSAYVFTRSGGAWTQQAKLTASDAAAFDSFGASVSVFGDTVIVGAYEDDHAGGTNAGSAYVFVRSGGTWTQQTKLTASDAAASDVFGRSVSISGDKAVVGAYGDDQGSGAYAGSAYLFVRSGTVWSQQSKLTASDAAASDVFGVSVGISGDRAAVGANHDDNSGGTDAGAAYVFDLNCPTPAEMNCDQAVDLLDVDAFVLALIDPAAYVNIYPDCNILNGDIDCSGVVDGLDIAPFVNCLLSGSGCPSCP
jgi:predicted amidohydrolase